MHDGHRNRLRENFIKSNYSTDNWQLHNVLELLLFYAIPRIDTNELAHKLLKEFGSISGVLDAPPERLKQIEGIGDNTVIFLKLLPQIFATYVEAHEKQQNTSKCLDNISDRINYFLPKFFGKSEECFYVLCLDNKCNIICCKELFQGSVNITPLNKRKIVEYALLNNASAIIIAHNHPGGIPLPSTADVAFTKQLKETLIPLNIDLVDHIIIAGNDGSSFADMNSI